MLRDYDPKNNPERSQLEKLRKQINMIDDELIHLLASRMHVAKEIGYYKKDHNITIFQSDRWKQILDKYKFRAEQHGLSIDFITRFIKAVHDESINQQEQVMDDAKEDIPKS